jgi:hypothetical protein
MRSHRSLKWIWLPLVCLSACSSTEREGNFSFRHHRQEFAGHSSTRIELLHGGKVITPRVSDWAVDPRNPDRIIYSTEEKTATGCGTFFLDAKAGATAKISPRAMTIHPAYKDSPVDFAGTDPWSPDSRYVFIGNDVAQAAVFDTSSLRTIDLTEAVSRDGRRLQMDALVWSPDSRRLAVIIAADGYNGDYDLTSMTVDPLSVQYVATMTGSLPLWTTADYRWEGSTLMVSTLGKNGSTFRKRPEDMTWIASPPREALRESAAECR